ncbi:unnamed protein product [Nippostrongylus brasiliensis]|uniref:Uncharacterized protein n=1 Tax=Nippostrongylus brasiliensis TaxID=27835 RepID=A0A0N4XM34_NIPBR|nr:unnamed protein product [Nippostrongylus brasiliensis]
MPLMKTLESVGGVLFCVVYASRQFEVDPLKLRRYDRLGSVLAASCVFLVDFAIGMEETEEAPPPVKERFKYLTFNQSVAAIGGDNAKFSRRLSHRPVDCELFFTEALTKWNDQDFGAQYTAFVDSLPSDELNTHAQLLHHKATICELLLKNLQDPVRRFSVIRCRNFVNKS